MGYEIRPEYTIAQMKDHLQATPALSENLIWVGNRCPGLNELREWCGANLLGGWAWVDSQFFGNDLREAFVFTEATDAILFKMTWD